MPKGTKASKQRKRVAVAKGLVAGKHPPQIAAEVGCSKQHVQRLAVEPETQELIQRILRPHEQRLAKMADKAIGAVEQGLEAKHDDEADHKARMIAVQRYGDLLELAQGGKREGPGGASAGSLTLVQIFELLQQTGGGNDGRNDGGN